MGRDQQHIQVPLLASPPPQTKGNEGSSPLQLLHTNRSPSSPGVGNAAAPWKNLTVGATAPRCFHMHLSEGKTPITLTPASICRRVIQHMCFQRAGGEGDLPLTYFLLLLEVLISMQNSASRQKLSLGSGIISALHRSLHHRSHQF